jgi:hypothetical protein
MCTPTAPSIAAAVWRPQEAHVYTNWLQTVVPCATATRPSQSSYLCSGPDPTSVRRRPWRRHPSLSSSAAPPHPTASRFSPLLLPPIARRRGRLSRPDGPQHALPLRCGEQGPGRPLGRARPSAAAAGERRPRVTGRARECCFSRRSGAPRPPTLSGSSSSPTLRFVPSINLSLFFPCR